MQRNWIIIGGGVGVVAAVVFVLVPNFVRPRYHFAKSSCIANLKQIDGAKVTWALENHKSNTDEPSTADLFGPTRYMHDVPVCEQGGTYTLGKVLEPPRCTIPYHSLDLGKVYVFDESREPLVGATVFVQGAISKGGKWPIIEATTETNGLGYVSDHVDGATGIAAFKSGYTTNSVPLTTTWPAKIVLKKLPP